jgi:hypothetical protein
VKATCAFCGKSFELDEPGGLHIAVFSDREETNQDLPAHAQCLSERLHPGVPFSASTFEPDSDD